MRLLYCSYHIFSILLRSILSYSLRGCVYRINLYFGKVIKFAFK
ncbi:hypothetical protein BGAFAR04_F0010 (plasmid) [Borreliella garinii Far04]|nr:hypothetical protein BGAFAR04_F0010 [Borreliella garinii Far04]